MTHLRRWRASDISFGRLWRIAHPCDMLQTKFAIGSHPLPSRIISMIHRRFSLHTLLLFVFAPFSPPPAYPIVLSFLRFRPPAGYGHAQGISLCPGCNLDSKDICEWPVCPTKRNHREQGRQMYRVANAATCDVLGLVWISTFCKDRTCVGPCDRHARSCTSCTSVTPRRGFAGS